jgi:hypothetical protein
MRILKKLPGYFSITALIISVLISAINRISPLTALYRIVVAVVTFYILGFCISAVLASEGEERRIKWVIHPAKTKTRRSLRNSSFRLLRRRSGISKVGGRQNGY